MRWRAVAFVPCALAACFDWSVATPDGGEDATVDALGPDAAADTGADADADVKVPPDAPDDCVALAASVASARAAAQICGSNCFDPGFLDECGCTVGVGDPSSGATQSYQAAIEAFADAGCACSGTVCSGTDGGLKCSLSADGGVCVP
jgi:hypothetical protein